MIELYENERIDDVNRNGYKVIQNKKDFCFGIDAVLLSGFAQAKKGERVLDLCTGTGIIPILMEAKTSGEHFSALEIQQKSAEMARRSVALNKLEDKIDIVEGDLKEIEKYFKHGSFEVVTCNPPYMPEGCGYKNELTPKLIARHEVMCNIYDVMQAADKMLKYGGRLYMVHRAERLADIFEAARGAHLEPKHLRMVHSTQDKEANLVLIEFMKGGKPSLKVDKPLVIYTEDRVYTEEVRKLYEE
jgi:tRNA1Val (adenine37-N6)-methyltransferase